MFDFVLSVGLVSDHAYAASGQPKINWAVRLWLAFHGKVFERPKCDTTLSLVLVFQKPVSFPLLNI